MTATSAGNRHRTLAASSIVAGITIVARLWTSHDRRAYGIWPDEPAQLGIARTLATSVRWNMYNHSTWRPGFGTLLAPTYWFTDDPVTVLHVGYGLNAVLGGIAAVLLFAMARRLTTLGVGAAAVTATLVSLAPALLFTTDYVWSESLVQPLYLGTVLALLRFFDRPSLGWAVAGGTLAVAAFGTHSRMLPLVLLVGAAVVISVARRRMVWWHGAVGIGWLALAFLGVTWYSEWIVDQLWERPFERNSYGGVLSQLAKVDDTLVSVLGQTWAQLVITCGLVGVGAVAVVRAAAGRPLAPADRDARRAPTTVDARVVVAAAGLLVGLSMLFMTDRWRSDQIVYPRYNDAALAPIVLLGIATLVTVRLSTVLRVLGGVAATTLLTGVVLDALRHDELIANDAVRQMILGLLAFMGRPRSIEVIPITIAAVLIVGFLAGWVVLSRLARLRSGVLLALAGLVVVGYLRADDIVNRNRNGWATLRSVAALEDIVLPDGATVDYVMKPGSNDTGRMMAYQFFLPHHDFTVITDVDNQAGSTPFLFAPDDQLSLAESGALIAWHDPSKPIALWVMPGEEQDRLLTSGLLEAPEIEGLDVLR